MGGQVIAVLYPTNERGNAPHKLNPRKRFSFVSSEKIRRLYWMPSRPDEDSRPTTEVNPSMMRELLARQRRLATGSDQLQPESRPTMAMHRDELLGLREQCAPEQIVVGKPAQPRVRRYVIGAAIACLATLWLAATSWLLATW
jgi:hypothetical protein